MQCWALILSGYGNEITFKPIKSHANAMDYLAYPLVFLLMKQMVYQFSGSYTTSDYRATSMSHPTRLTIGQCTQIHPKWLA